MFFSINVRLMCLKTLNLSCIIKGQPIVIILSNPHFFLLEWVPYCRLFSQKYLGIILTNNIVLITSKFFMMNQKTGPCDPSNAYVSHTTPASCLYAIHCNPPLTRALLSGVRPIWLSSLRTCYWVRFSFST